MADEECSWLMSQQLMSQQQTMALTGAIERDHSLVEWETEVRNSWMLLK